MKNINNNCLIDKYLNLKKELKDIEKEIILRYKNGEEFKNITFAEYSNYKFDFDNLLNNINNFYGEDFERLYEYTIDNSKIKKLISFMKKNENFKSFFIKKPIKYGKLSRILCKSDRQYLNSITKKTTKSITIKEKNEDKRKCVKKNINS